MYPFIAVSQYQLSKLKHILNGHVTSPTFARLLSLFVLSDLYLQLFASGFPHTPPIQKFPPQGRVALAARGPYGHFTEDDFWPITVNGQSNTPIMDSFPVFCGRQWAAWYWSKAKKKLTNSKSNNALKFSFQSFFVFFLYVRKRRNARKCLRFRSKKAKKQ